MATKPKWNQNEPAVVSLRRLRDNEPPRKERQRHDAWEAAIRREEARELKEREAAQDRVGEAFDS